MSENINYLILYLKKKYNISSELQKYLYNENFTSPFALLYIDVNEAPTLSTCDINVLNMIKDFSNEKLTNIRNNLILHNKLYDFDSEKMDFLTCLELEFFISTDLKMYLENVKCTSPYGLLNILDNIEQDSILKHGDKCFLTYFNNLSKYEYKNIIQFININNNNKKCIIRYFKNIENEDNGNEDEYMDIDP